MKNRKYLGRSLTKDMQVYTKNYKPLLRETEDVNGEPVIN
jgi:hypothetical protein